VCWGASPPKPPKRKRQEQKTRARAEGGLKPAVLKRARAKDKVKRQEQGQNLKKLALFVPAEAHHRPYHHFIHGNAVDICKITQIFHFFSREPD